MREDLEYSLFGFRVKRDC